jgi:polysaccharide export outer membrane protein
MKRFLFGGTGLLVVLAILGVAPVAAQDDYTLGPEDVVAISVWLHPELERTVAIRADGNITFAPIGEIKAAGLTTKQLGDRIADRLSTYLRQTTTVTVTVSEFLSRSVFVSGAVAKPGRYGYERIPGVVDVISGAGGALPGADLARVQLIRRDGDARSTTVVDVASALRDGTGGPMPELRPGDTIVVPGAPGGAAGGTVAAGDAVGVLGQVAKPGLYLVGDGQDLWAVLAQAGGLTQQGDLSDIRIVTRQDQTQSVITVNLKDALRRGRPTPFVVRAGDIVFVSATGTSAVARGWQGLQSVLGVSLDVLNLIVIRDALKD